MAIKSDRWIRAQALKGMIEPFSEKQVREGVVSYGLSSYGYDLRVSDDFRIFTNVNSAIVDPKHFDERSFVQVNAESVLIPPNSFALARSVEYFRIPRDVLTICVGKSTCPDLFRCKGRQRECGALVRGDSESLEFAQGRLDA